MPPAGQVRPDSAPSAASRQGWRLLHRWIGLATGSVLLLCATTGLWLTLVAPQETQRLSALCGTGPTAALQRLAEAAAADKGPLESLTLRLPDQQRGCVTAFVQANAWQGELFLDPATGSIVARREQGEGWHGLLFELHSNLLLGRTGKATLALCGAAAAVLLLSGLALWWPLRRGGSLRVRLRAGSRAALTTGHRSAGVLLGLVVMATAASGVYVAWRPIATWVNTLAGTPRASPPALPRVPEGPAAGPAPSAGGTAAADRGTEPPPALDALAQAAAWPSAAQATLVDIGVAVAATGPVRLRYRLAGDPHPNGQSYVWVDPRDARVLARQRWDEADLGARVQGWLYAYHAGKLWGLPHTALLVLAGVALMWLALSGPLAWGLRWRTRSRGTVSIANTPRPS